MQEPKRLAEEVEWYTGCGDEDTAYEEGRLVDVYNLSPSQFTEFSLFMPTGGEYKNFSFQGREYLRQIYDTPTNRRIIMAGRQVEKSQVISSGYMIGAYGEDIKLKDVVEGAEVLSVVMSSGARVGKGRVSWVSRRYSKPCVKIRTRQGHEIEVATTHPMRLWERWVEAGKLCSGDRLAVLRRGGLFGKKKVEQYRPELTAYMIADGGLGQQTINITKGPGPVRRELLRLLSRIGMTHRRVDSTFFLHKGILHEWLGEDGLLGCRSSEKFVPAWVFQLPKPATARFLNRLWACDGHVKKVSQSKYDIVYSSTSLRLVRQVQALLWKFGIPTGYRSYKPEVYEGTEKLHHMIRVETQDGIRRFLTEVGALGKSEDVPLPDKEENNNRDTYPIEVNDLLLQIAESHPNYSSKKRSKLSLHAAGLRRKLEYPPTKEKLQQYLEFFSQPGFDQELVGQLAAHLETDLYWDEIVEIEDIGEQECVDFEVEEHHNFIANGFVTHNSTLLGNQILAYCALNAGFRALYVSPSHTQTKVFSRDRIKEPVETSEVLKGFTNSKLLANVLEKKFVNRSQVTLRFAFLNADRCISGDSLIQQQDGSLVPIKDLAGRRGKVKVATVCETNHRPHFDWGMGARSNGFREVVEVKTTFPVPIKVTPDHRVLTGRGWVEAGELREGDYILAPHLQPTVSHPIGEDLAWLIGAMIAEGECSDPKSVRFTNTDEEYFNEFVERAERFGVNLGSVGTDTRYEKPCFVVGLYSDTKGPGITGAKNVLWDKGEFGAKSTEKHIPAAILRATLEEKALFLRALFHGDGWCCPEGGAGRAGYSTSSKRLAEQLCTLLWTLGIRTGLRVKAPSTDNAQESYTISFSVGETAKLVGLIGEYRPGLSYRPSRRDHNDRIPMSYDHLRELDVVDPKKAWVEVKSVEYAGIEEVFDLTVPTTEAFVANGLVVHNCRGIPADYILIDEFQDIILENIPVIEECASHSDYKFFTYSGTPKSLDNPLEFYYRRFSTQNEWAVPCKKHGTPKDPASWYWNILDEDNIGKEGLICDRCKAPLDPADLDAQWAALNPTPNVERPFEGFRIPQLMVPWIDWDDILDKQRKYSRPKFYNEVLGLSYDSGVRPLTLMDVKDNCNSKLSMTHYRTVKERHGAEAPIFMGIDWGSAESSFTVISLGGYMPWDPELYTIFYIHRCEGPESEPKRQIELVKDLVDFFNVAVIGVDYGGGHWPNDELLRRYGTEKVKKFQWVGRIKQKIIYEPGLTIPRYLCHRTEIMSDMFNAIKRRNVFRFPRWQEFQDPFAADMLNIFSEYNERLRENVYKHAPGMPDDSFHSITFNFLASFHHKRRPDVVAPTKESAEVRDSPLEELDIN